MEPRSWDRCTANCARALNHVYQEYHHQMEPGDVLITEYGHEITDSNTEAYSLESTSEERCFSKDITYITEAGTSMHLSDMVEVAYDIDTGKHIERLLKLEERMNDFETKVAFAAWLGAAREALASTRLPRELRREIIGFLGPMP